MKRIIIHPSENGAEEKETKGPLKLEELQKLTGAEYVDIIIRKIGGREYHIVVDDMGALKKDRKPVASALDAKEVLFGTIIVTRYAYEGDEEGLTPEDIENVLAHTYEKPHEKTFMLYCVRTDI